MMSTLCVTSILGYAGLIPFVVPAALIVFDSEHAVVLTELVKAYAFGIICFLTGSWWGLALLPGSRNALLMSNLFFLIAFFGYLFASEAWSLAAAMLLMLIFLSERYASLFSEFTSAYRNMRAILSLIASLSMLTVHFAG